MRAKEEKERRRNLNPSTLDPEPEGIPRVRMMSSWSRRPACRRSPNPHAWIGIKPQPQNLGPWTDPWP
jgi:hypothetical protein